LCKRRRFKASPAKDEGRSAGLHRRRVSASCRKGSAVGKFAAGETGSVRWWLASLARFQLHIDLKHFFSCRPIRPAFPYTPDRPCGTARSGINAPGWRSPRFGLTSPVDLGHCLRRKCIVGRYGRERDLGSTRYNREMALYIQPEPTVARIETGWRRRTQGNA